MVARGVGRKVSGEAGALDGWGILEEGVLGPSDLANHQVIFSFSASFLLGLTYFLLGPGLGVSIQVLLNWFLANILTEFACNCPTRGVAGGAISKLSLPTFLDESSLSLPCQRKCHTL